MKSRIATCILTLAFFAALTNPAPLVAQNKRNHKPKHHHYKLIDFGTFGGPQSWVYGWDNFPGTMSNSGVVGGADTFASNPFYPNFNPFMGLTNFGYSFLESDPFVEHAFQSKDGALVDLGVLPGGYNSFAQWVSGNGIVVGASENGVIDPVAGWPEVRAVLWQNGRPEDLGTFGGSEAAAFAVNNQKQVVGLTSNTIPDPFSGFGTQGRAFRWQNGTMEDLGLLGTGTFAIAVDINEPGQVVGAALTSTVINPNTGFPQQDSFFWEDNGEGMVDIPTLGGGISVPYVINNNGEVVGESNTLGDVPGTEHGYYWDKKRGVVDLGTFGGPFSEAEWINDAGDIVGNAQLPNSVVGHAALWIDLQINDIGALPDPRLCGVAKSINSKRQVVGYSDDCSDANKHAFLWERGGPMVDLNDLIPPKPSLELLNAISINDRGEIGGEGATSDGNVHSFLLIPCDEHHPGIEGCDYSLLESSAAVPRTVPALHDAVSRTLPPLAVRRGHRFHIPGPAGPRN